MKILSKVLFLFTVIAAATGLAHSQTTATLTGTVKDPQGAVIAGATITVHAVATGADRTAVSDNAGDYVLSSLQPGEYTVQVKMAGFALYTVKSLVLQVDQKASLPFSLSLQSADEIIQVEVGAPLIAAASITVGQLSVKAEVH